MEPEKGAELFQPRVSLREAWPDEWPERPLKRQGRGGTGRPAAYDENLPEGDVFGVAFIIVRGGPWWRRVLLWVPDRIRMAHVTSLPFGRSR
jgi:hypothetical protein